MATGCISAPGFPVSTYREIQIKPFLKFQIRPLRLITSGGSSNLGMLLIQLHLRHQTFDTVAELTVLGGVDESVVTAVVGH